MNFILRAVCLVLVITMILSFIGCDKAGNSSNITNSNSISSEDESSISLDTSSEIDSSDFSSGYDIEAFKPVEPDSTKNPYTEFDPTYNDENDNHDSAGNTDDNSSSLPSTPSSSSESSSSITSSTASTPSSSKPGFEQSKYGYTYVWGDEFDGTGLNKNLWSDKDTKMTGRNVLLVESTSKTISVKNGNLILTAYKDKSGVYHVPTSVHTQGTMNYQYGYIEMRAKLSLEVGSFASFWTRSIGDKPAASLTTTNLKQFGEVDIFEVFQYKGKQYLGGNIHKNSKISELNWYATPMTWSQKRIVPDEDYHTYGYEWTPTEIKLYFDGEVYARFDISKSWTGDSTEGMGLPGWNRNVSRYKDTTGTGMECLNDPQYLIFNHHLHIKVIDGDGKSTGFLASTSVTENESFEKADYIIDYVRLYQKNGQKLYTK